LVPENGDQGDPVVPLVLPFRGGSPHPLWAFEGRYMLGWFGESPPYFVALGSMMLIKQFQRYRYQGYGEALGNPALSARKILS